MDLIGHSASWSWILWHPKFWMTIGFLGQGIFTARFLVQWCASEREQDSVVPVSFWWISLAAAQRFWLTRSTGVTRRSLSGKRWGFLFMYET